MKKVTIVLVINLVIILLCFSYSCAEKKSEHNSFTSKEEIKEKYLESYEICKDMQYKSRGEQVFEEYKTVKNQLVVKYFSDEDYSKEKAELEKIVNELNVITNHNDGIEVYYISDYNGEILKNIIRKMPDGKLLQSEYLKILVDY